MGVLGDRFDRLAQLLESGQVGGEGRLGADLFGFGAFGDGPVVDAAGQPVQRGADGGAQDVGGLGVGQRGQLADGLDAQPMQLLLGDRPDPPQPAHRQPAEQLAFLGAAHHPDPVRFGQAGGDLGDLLARARAHRGDQPGLLTNPSAQLFAERLDVLSRRAGELGRLAEPLVEGQLLDDGHHGADGVEDPPAGHAIDHAARRQHHRGDADQPLGLMHGHGRAGAEHARLVAGAGHHAAATQTTHQHRTPAQRRAGELLDGREERVHVQVQHPSGLHPIDAIARACCGPG
ncbi:hypothetical protein MAHJHV61_05020 [Mycobacterium avium subsp. hominissuis]